MSAESIFRSAPIFRIPRFRLRPRLRPAREVSAANVSPHWWQNRLSIGLAAPQWGQYAGISVPQWLQKTADSTASRWQWGHSMGQRSVDVPARNECCDKQSPCYRPNRARGGGRGWRQQKFAELEGCCAISCYQMSASAARTPCGWWDAVTMIVLSDGTCRVGSSGIQSSRRLIPLSAAVR